MADKEQINIIKQGVEVWNNWRNENRTVQIDLSNEDFHGVDLSNANLFRSNFYKANLTNAILVKTNLTGANLYKTNLTGANLSGAILEQAGLNDVQLNDAILTGCYLYGFSAWDLKGTPKDQSNLVITKKTGTEVGPDITVDDLQLAQFIYLLLNNQNLRSVIDTITSKAVLILGRFTPQRKEVLDAMRKKLQNLNFTPIIFDFEKPKTKDVTGTVETLARMVRFIIADLTDPSSIPHELATLAPHLRTTPIQLLKLKGTETYSMFKDYKGSYKWILGPYVYKDSNSLIENMEKIIIPANKLFEKLKK
ncbi:pentapeptide repeat-containing protein [Aquiflexum sp. TKW24L]|uniref:pentapeptide repeat-containing protein n=1 Tax=Aquiflexum sp. TKW24L TaxID=2942212 RepID=UPI0020BF1961|nr:pentapeptide repeat-containing protein [Aquiflexum sp. TKW24L]MCL6257455.1 pentapeptide repeat-containing protein [Aquiflexum sp. TKW24L]